MEVTEFTTLGREVASADLWQRGWCGRWGCVCAETEIVGDRDTDRGHFGCSQRGAFTKHLHRHSDQCLLCRRLR